MSAPARQPPTRDRSRPRSRPGRFALFRRADFRRIWLAGGFSGTIRWLETLAIGLYTFHETGSPFLVTVMLFARTLPAILLGAPIGALAARLRIKPAAGSGKVWSARRRNRDLRLARPRPAEPNQDQDDR